jgi:hypothetical protein
MSRLLRVAALLCAVSLLVSAAAGAKERRSAVAPEDKPQRLDRGGVVSYTIDPVSPLTQSWPQIDFEGPYYYFVLTNNSAQAEDFFLQVLNIVGGSAFGQVCLRSTCYPDSTTLTFESGQSDTIGVNVAPFSDGVYTFDFLVQSVTDPGQSVTYPLTLYAGTAAVGAPEVAGASTGLLGQNVPNPVRGSTSITFVVPREERVQLRVFDVSGRLVDTLADGTFTPGSHTVSWDAVTQDGAGLPNGVYYYRLDTSRGTESKRLTLIR